MIRIAPSFRPQPVIPTASMADIAFLLIIFFMVTTGTEVGRTPVDLPVSHVRVPVDDRALVVIVEPAGAGPGVPFLVRVAQGRQAPRGVEGVEGAADEIGRALRTQPGRPVVLEADASLPWEQIDRFLAALRGAGARELVLLTLSEESRRPGP